MDFWCINNFLCCLEQIAFSQSYGPWAILLNWVDLLKKWISEPKTHANISKAETIPELGPEHKLPLDLTLPTAKDSG